MRRFKRNSTLYRESSYGLRRRFEAEDDSNAKNVEEPSYFKGTSDYVKFIDNLKKGVTDPKALAWIDFAFGGNNPDVKFTVDSATGVPVRDLKPTQNFIGFENSIGFAVSKPDKSKESLTAMITEGSPTITPGKPIWIFNGKYIIDGHHRWSQVYAFNPNAKVMAINFKSSGIQPKQALAAVQGVIASVLNKIPIATSKVDGQAEKVAANVLKADASTLYKAAADQLASSGDGFEQNCYDILGLGKKEDSDKKESLRRRLRENLHRRFEESLRMRRMFEADGEGDDNTKSGGSSPVDKLKRMADDIPDAMKEVYGIA